MYRMMHSSENVNSITHFVAVQYLREMQVELNFKTINQIKFVCWMLKFLMRLPLVIVCV